LGKELQTTTTEQETVEAGEKLKMSYAIPPDPGIPFWAYTRRVSDEKHWNSAFNGMAHEGWELVSVVHEEKAVIGYFRRNEREYFKRVREELKRLEALSKRPKQET
jgi:hypothetical protein